MRNTPECRSLGRLVFKSGVFENGGSGGKKKIVSRNFDFGVLSFNFGFLFFWYVKTDPLLQKDLFENVPKCLVKGSNKLSISFRCFAGATSKVPEAENVALWRFTISSPSKIPKEYLGHGTSMHR